MSGNGQVRGARAVTIARSAPAALAVPIASAAATVRRRYQHWWWVPGWLFAAITELPALLAIAWLLPGTAMLLAGRLLPTPLLIIFVPLALALCYFAMGQLPVSWPRFGDSSLLPESAVLAESGIRAQPGARGEPRVRAGTPGRRPDVPADAVLATVAVAVGFAVWQVVYRSQQVIVVSDPGVYLQYGYWIAAHGSARIPESATAFGSATGLNFASLGFHQSGGFVTPAFMPGLPLVLAAGTWLGGAPGALLMAPVIGGCAVLSFAGLVGRLAGPRWAPAGALVLALTLPQQYVSRTPFSGPLVQVLLFGGLCLVTDSLVVRRRGYGGAAMTLALLGGLALGLTVLADIGSLSVLLPAFPVLAVMFVTRRPQAGPLGLGLFAGMACGLCAGLMLARPYLSSISPQLHLFGLCAVGFGVVTALAAPLAFPGARAWARRVFVTRARVVGLRSKTLSLPSLGTISQWVVFAVPAVALIVFAIRPYYQTTRGQTDPFVIRYVAALQRLAHLPVDGRRQYYESSLDWVLWYLGIPAVLLAMAGAAGLGRRLVRAALTWRESLIAARLWTLPFLLIGWSVATVLWDPAVLPDQPSASHRLVPVVLPGLILLAVWVSSRLQAHAAVLGASGATSALVGLCCVLAMAIPPFMTSMNPGLAARPSVGPHSSGLSKFVSRIRFQGQGASATYGGSVAAVSGLCSAIGTDASVVFVDTATANSFGQVVRGICGQPAASAAGSSAVTIEQVVTSVEHAGRRPVLLGASRARLAVFGVVPRKALSLRTAGDAHVLTGPPASTWPTSYTVWMAAPLGSGSGSGSANSGGV